MLVAGEEERGLDLVGLQESLGPVHLEWEVVPLLGVGHGEGEHGEARHEDVEVGGGVPELLFGPVPLALPEDRGPGFEFLMVAVIDEDDLDLLALAEVVVRVDALAESERVIRGDFVEVEEVSLALAFVGQPAIGAVVTVVVIVLGADHRCDLPEGR